MSSSMKLLGSLILLATGLGAPTVTKAAACMQRGDMHLQIREMYAETPRTIALSSDNILIETYVEENTGAWATFGTSSAGIMCLLTFGTAFEQSQELTNGPAETAIRFR